jgi:broad specificity phosphatase PhoE
MAMRVLPAKDMTRTLLLVRHGETEWNREGRFQGHSDVPLSELGKSQARALRSRLETALDGHLFDDDHTAVMTSDLRRAHETAELAFGRDGRTLHVRRELREFSYGVFEGFTRAEIDQRYPGAMLAWLHGDRDTAVPGGESRAAVHARALAAVQSFLEAMPQRHIVVVSHGGVMRQLLALCFDDRSEPRSLSFANTATHLIQVEPTRWTYGGPL